MRENASAECLHWKKEVKEKKEKKMKKREWKEKQRKSLHNKIQGNLKDENEKLVKRKAKVIK